MEETSAPPLSCSKATQSLNAPLLIIFNESGNSIKESFSQPLNTSNPIFVTFWGSTTFSKDVHSEKI